MVGWDDGVSIPAALPLAAAALARALSAAKSVALDCPKRLILFSALARNQEYKAFLTGFSFKQLSSSVYRIYVILYISTRLWYTLVAVYLLLLEYKEVKNVPANRKFYGLVRSKHCSSLCLQVA